jgi:hypothetical protein
MKRKRCCGACAEPLCGQTEEVSISAMPVSMPGVFVTTSKSQEGKSHLLKYIAYEHRHHIDYMVGISGTGADEDNLPFLPKKMVYYNWPGKITPRKPQGETKYAIEELVKAQLKIPKSHRPLLAIAIEDEIKALKDPLIEAIATRPFHYNVWLFVAANYVNSIPPVIREGAWQVALFKLYAKISLEEAYKSYGLDCWDLADFRKMISEKTGEYRFAYRNLKGKSKVGKDWISMRAPAVIPQFTIAPPNEKEEEEEEP